MTRPDYARDHAAWQRQYSKLRAIADRIADMRRDRARQLCREAGLDPMLLGIHPHNAMVSLHAGAPWPGVDYAKVRKVIWLLNRQFDGSRLVDAWDQRVRCKD